MSNLDSTVDRRSRGGKPNILTRRGCTVHSTVFKRIKNASERNLLHLLCVMSDFSQSVPLCLADIFVFSKKLELGLTIQDLTSLLESLVKLGAIKFGPSKIYYLIPQTVISLGFSPSNSVLRLLRNKDPVGYHRVRPKTADSCAPVDAQEAQDFHDLLAAYTEMVTKLEVLLNSRVGRRTPLVFSRPNMAQIVTRRAIRAVKKFWKSKGGLEKDDYRAYFYTQFDHRQWERIVFLNHCATDRAWDLWLQDGSANKGHIFVLDKQVADRSEIDFSSRSPYRDIYPWVERNKKHLVLTLKDPEHCFRNMSFTFGYHPKSEICKVCPIAQKCATVLFQGVIMITNGAVDVMALRRGDITLEWACSEVRKRGLQNRFRAIPDFPTQLKIPDPRVVEEKTNG